VISVYLPMRVIVLPALLLIVMNWPGSYQPRILAKFTTFCLTRSCASIGSNCMAHHRRDNLLRSLVIECSYVLPPRQRRFLPFSTALIGVRDPPWLRSLLHTGLKRTLPKQSNKSKSITCHIERGHCVLDDGGDDCAIVGDQFSERD
jgi:hypothetical protein